MTESNPIQEYQSQRPTQIIKEVATQAGLNRAQINYSEGPSHAAVTENDEKYLLSLNDEIIWDDGQESAAHEAAHVLLYHNNPRYRELSNNIQIQFRDFKAAASVSISLEQIQKLIHSFLFCRAYEEMVAVYLGKTYGKRYSMLIAKTRTSSEDIQHVEQALINEYKEMKERMSKDTLIQTIRKRPKSGLSFIASSVGTSDQWKKDFEKFWDEKSQQFGANLGFIIASRKISQRKVFLLDPLKLGEILFETLDAVVNENQPSSMIADILADLVKYSPEVPPTIPLGYEPA